MAVVALREITHKGAKREINIGPQRLVLAIFISHVEYLACLHVGFWHDFTLVKCTDICISIKEKKNH